MQVNINKKNDIYIGLLLCVIVSVCIVLLRGAKWDESFEHAQVLSGAVAYPADHPLPIYVQSPKTIQLVLSTWLLEWNQSAVLVNGLRNLFFMLATILPIYLFVSVFTKSIAIPFLAVLLVLQGIFLEFDGSYPIQLWPELYSNGHIGIGLAGVVLYLWMRERYACAGFTLVLLAATHVGQTPPLLATIALGGLSLLKQKNWKAIGQGIGGGGIALALAIGMLLSVAWHFGTAQALGDWPVVESSPEEIHAIWHQFTTRMDPHRRIPGMNGFLVLLLTGLLGLVAWRGEEDGILKQTYRVVLLYVTCLTTIVYSIALIHTLLKEDTPFLLIGWMPYRLINHMPMILGALLVVSLWRTLAGRLIVLGAVGFGILHPWLSPWIPEAVYGRYIAGGGGVLFGLWGASMISWRKKGTYHTLIALGVGVLCSLGHSFGLLCMLTGVMLYVILEGFLKEHEGMRPKLYAVCWGVVFLGLGLQLLNQAQHRNHLPRSPMESAIASLVVESDETPFILAPPGSYMLQARTGAAVFIDAATASFVSYDRALGPRINRMLGDAYGAAYQIRPDADPTHASWEDYWESMTLEDWKRLEQDYGLTHVLAPQDMALPLPVTLKAGVTQLYALP